MDGKIAADNGSSKWITNDLSRTRVHHLRHEVDAILTTINTVKQDNPTLNVRLENPYKHPIRVILDPILEINLNNNICQTANEINTFIFYHESITDLTKINQLRNIGIQAIPAKMSNSHKFSLDFDDILLKLGSLNISSVMIEAGGKLNSYLLKNKFIDKLYYFIAPKIIGGSFSVYDSLNIADMSQIIELSKQSIEVLNDNILIIGYPKYV